MTKKLINKKPAQGVKWDLSDFYSGMTDPRINRDKKEIIRLTNSFVKKYKGKINSPKLSPDFFLQALKDYEKILEKLYIYEGFTSALHFKDTASEDISQVFQEAQEFTNDISAELLWFELEWVKLDGAAKNIIQSPKLKDYCHYLQHERMFKPFRLSEPEEKILAKKAQTSSLALVRFFDEIDSNLKYKLKVEGKITELSLSELSPYLTVHPKRQVRKNAARALTKGLKKNARPYTFLLNTLILDKKVIDEIRGYKYPQQATFLDYEVKPETVKKMTETIARRYDICEKFYKAKRKVLRHRSLYEWDRYSSIYSKKQVDYSWKEAKDIVLKAFGEFSPRFQKVAQEFFENKWIDAEITKGKQGGAFCKYNVPSKHPFVFLNFSGKIGNVVELAHELGHGIHSYLARKQNLLHFWPSTAVAEIASVFSEMLVFEKLYHSLEDRQLKINLLGDKIQDIFATIFRQNAFYLFEKDIHNYRRAKGELKTADFNKFYQNRLQAMFKKGLKLTDGHQYWWMPILHFYHYNFYVFSYCFGEALTIALYARYKKEGQNFVKNYLEALSAGGSKPPREIIKMMGIDFTKKGFWEQGLDWIEELVKEFETLTANKNAR